MFADLGERLSALVTSGPLFAGIVASLLAGVVSFLSPCVLPLVPGYLSYVTGLAGADVDAAIGSTPQGAPVSKAGSLGSRLRLRGRMIAGISLFIAGFSAVFITGAFAASTLGSLLYQHERLLEIGVGVVMAAMGLLYLGLIPAWQGQWRPALTPAAGLAGAPLVGAVFGLGWTPCLGPTLAAVLGLATVEGVPWRGVVLAVAYCVGLGVPFLIFGVGLRRALTTFTAIRRHSRWVTRIGGTLLILLAILLISGTWNGAMIWLRTAVPVPAGLL